MKVKEYQLHNQPISNDDVRLTVLQLANANGGLKSIARKARIHYDALWGQLNRNACFPAWTIPRLVNATGKLEPLQILADACGCLVIRKVRPLKCIRSIRKQELNLYSQLTAAVKTIENAFLDGIVDRNEFRQINYHANELRRLVAELAEKIRKGARL